MFYTNNRGKIIFKSISIIIVLCFFFQDIAWATNGLPLWSVINGNRVLEARAKDFTSLAKITIPKDYGIIKEVHNTGSDKVIINIQDAHSNLGAQESINKIIGALESDYSLKLISLEGARGYVDTSLFQSHPDDNARKEIARYFLNRGKINAAEYYKISSDSDIKLYGAEDASLYRANVDSYIKSLKNKGQVHKAVITLKKAISDLKAKAYSKRLRELDKKRWAYRVADMSFKEYWKYLGKLAKALRVDISDYTNIKAILTASELEERTDFKQAEKERQALIELLGKTLSKKDMERLLYESVSFRAGRIEASVFHNHLREMALFCGIDISLYPNLSFYTDYINKHSDVIIDELFIELDELIYRIQEKSFRNDDERLLADISKRADIIIDLLDAKIINRDLAYYKTNKKAFLPQNIAHDITRLTNKYNVNANLVPEMRVIAEALPNVERFYDLAFQRDLAMVDNTIAKMEKDGRLLAVLITGGFHTEGIANILKKKNISYMVVLPKFSKESLDRPYEDIILNKRQPFEEVLSKGEYYLQGASIFSGFQPASEQRIAFLTFTLLLSLDAMKAEDSQAVVRLDKDFFKVTKKGQKITVESVLPEADLQVIDHTQQTAQNLVKVLKKWNRIRRKEESSGEAINNIFTPENLESLIRNMLSDTKLGRSEFKKHELEGAIKDYTDILSSESGRIDVLSAAGAVLERQFQRAFEHLQSLKGMPGYDIEKRKLERIYKSRLTVALENEELKKKIETLEKRVLIKDRGKIKEVLKPSGKILAQEEIDMLLKPIPGEEEEPAEKKEPVSEDVSVKASSAGLKTREEEKSEILEAIAVKPDERLDGILKAEIEPLLKMGINPSNIISKLKVQIDAARNMVKGFMYLIPMGFGKSLTFRLAAFTLAKQMGYTLANNKGVLISTVSHDLAKRDAENAGKILSGFGMSVGVLTDGEDGAKIWMVYDKRSGRLIKTEGPSDVTFGTVDAFVHIYENEELVKSLHERVFSLKGRKYFMLFDEADVSLIEQLGTPFIIAGGKAKNAENIKKRYLAARQLTERLLGENTIKQIARNGLIDVSEMTAGKRIYLTKKGRDALKEMLEKEEYENLAKDTGFANDNIVAWADLVNQALSVEGCYTHGIEYTIRDRKIVLIDETSNTEMPGRRMQAGYHAALEAKHQKQGVEVEPEQVTTNTMMLKSFLKSGIIDDFAGASGTMNKEFMKRVHEKVVIEPELADGDVSKRDDIIRMYKAEASKWDGFYNDVLTKINNGVAVLINAKEGMPDKIIDEIHIRYEERYGKDEYDKRFPAGRTNKQLGIRVFNATSLTDIIEIEENAGKPGAITIVTNRGTRGVDIKQDTQSIAIEKGFDEAAARLIKEGVYSYSTYIHESQATDTQFRGRIARLPGTRGVWTAYWSCEDEIFIKYKENNAVGTMLSSLLHEIEVAGEPIDADDKREPANIIELIGALRDAITDSKIEQFKQDEPFENEIEERKSSIKVLREAVLNEDFDNQALNKLIPGIEEFVLRIQDREAMDILRTGMLGMFDEALIMYLDPVLGARNRLSQEMQSAKWKGIITQAKPIINFRTISEIAYDKAIKYIQDTAVSKLSLEISKADKRTPPFGVVRRARDALTDGTLKKATGLLFAGSIIGAGLLFLSKIMAVFNLVGLIMSGNTAILSESLLLKSISGMFSMLPITFWIGLAAFVIIAGITLYQTYIKLFNQVYQEKLMTSLGLVVRGTFTPGELGKAILGIPVTAFSMLASAAPLASIFTLISAAVFPVSAPLLIPIAIAIGLAGIISTAILVNPFTIKRLQSEKLKAPGDIARGMRSALFGLGFTVIGVLSVMLIPSLAGILVPVTILMLSNILSEKALSRFYEKRLESSYAAKRAKAIGAGISPFIFAGLTGLVFLITSSDIAFVVSTAVFSAPLAVMALLYFIALPYMSSRFGRIESETVGSEHKSAAIREGLQAGFTNIRTLWIGFGALAVTLSSIMMVFTALPIWGVVIIGIEVFVLSTIAIMSISNLRVKRAKGEKLKGLQGKIAEYLTDSRKATQALMASTTLAVAGPALGSGAMLSSIAQGTYSSSANQQLIDNLSAIFAPFTPRAPTEVKPQVIYKQITRPAKPAPAKIEPQIYTVKAGDSLSAIARRLLGNLDEWREIYKLNRDLVGDNPNLIHPGMRLILPVLLPAPPPPGEEVAEPSAHMPLFAGFEDMPTQSRSEEVQGAWKRLKQLAIEAAEKNELLSEEAERSLREQLRLIIDNLQSQINAQKYQEQQAINVADETAAGLESFHRAEENYQRYIKQHRFYQRQLFDSMDKRFKLNINVGAPTSLTNTIVSVGDGNFIGIRADGPNSRTLNNLLGLIGIMAEDVSADIYPMIALTLLYELTTAYAVDDVQEQGGALLPGYFTIDVWVNNPENMLTNPDGKSINYTVWPNTRLAGPADLSNIPGNLIRWIRLALGHDLGTYKFAPEQLMSWLLAAADTDANSDTAYWTVERPDIELGAEVDISHFRNMDGYEELKAKYDKSGKITVEDIKKILDENDDTFLFIFGRDSTDIRLSDNGKGYYIIHKDNPEKSAFFNLEDMKIYTIDPNLNQIQRGCRYVYTRDANGDRKVDLVTNKYELQRQVLYEVRMYDESVRDRLETDNPETNAWLKEGHMFVVPTGRDMQNMSRALIYRQQGIGAVVINPRTKQVTTTDKIPALISTRAAMSVDNVFTKSNDGTFLMATAFTSPEGMFVEPSILAMDLRYQHFNHKKILCDVRYNRETKIVDQDGILPSIFTIRRIVTMRSEIERDVNGKIVRDKKGMPKLTEAPTYKYYIETEDHQYLRGLGFDIVADRDFARISFTPNTEMVTLLNNDNQVIEIEVGIDGAISSVKIGGADMDKDKIELTLNPQRPSSVTYRRQINTDIVAIINAPDTTYLLDNQNRLTDLSGNPITDYTDLAGNPLALFPIKNISAIGPLGIETSYPGIGVQILGEDTGVTYDYPNQTRGIEATEEGEIREAIMPAVVSPTKAALDMRMRREELGVGVTIGNRQHLPDENNLGYPFDPYKEIPLKRETREPIAFFDTKDGNVVRDYISANIAGFGGQDGIMHRLVSASASEQALEQELAEQARSLEMTLEEYRQMLAIYLRRNEEHLKARAKLKTETLNTVISMLEQNQSVTAKLQYERFFQMMQMQYNLWQKDKIESINEQITIQSAVRESLIEEAVNVQDQIDSLTPSDPALPAFESSLDNLNLAIDGLEQEIVGMQKDVDYYSKPADFVNNPEAVNAQWTQMQRYALDVSYGLTIGGVETPEYLKARDESEDYFEYRAKLIKESGNWYKNLDVSEARLLGAADEVLNKSFQFLLDKRHMRMMGKALNEVSAEISEKRRASFEANAKDIEIKLRAAIDAVAKREGWSTEHKKRVIDQADELILKIALNKDAFVDLIYTSRQLKDIGLPEAAGLGWDSAEKLLSLPIGYVLNSRTAAIEDVYRFAKNAGIDAILINHQVAPGKFVKLIGIAMDVEGENWKLLSGVFGGEYIELLEKYGGEYDKESSVVYGLFANPSVDINDRLMLSGVGLLSVNGAGGGNSMVSGKIDYTATDNLHLFAGAGWMGADAEGAVNIFNKDKSPIPVRTISGTSMIRAELGAGYTDITTGINMRLSYVQLGPDSGAGAAIKTPLYNITSGFSMGIDGGAFLNRDSLYNAGITFAFGKSAQIKDMLTESRKLLRDVEEGKRGRIEPGKEIPMPIPSAKSPSIEPMLLDNLREFKAEPSIPGPMNYAAQQFIRQRADSATGFATRQDLTFTLTRNNLYVALSDPTLAPKIYSTYLEIFERKKMSPMALKKGEAIALFNDRYNARNTGLRVSRQVEDDIASTALIADGMIEYANANPESELSKRIRPYLHSLAEDLLNRQRRDGAIHCLSRDSKDRGRTEIVVSDNLPAKRFLEKYAEYLSIEPFETSDGITIGSKRYETAAIKIKEWFSSKSVISEIWNAETSRFISSMDIERWHRTITKGSLKETLTALIYLDDIQVQVLTGKTKEKILNQIKKNNLLTVNVEVEKGYGRLEEVKSTGMRASERGIPTIDTEATLLLAYAYKTIGHYSDMGAIFKGMDSVSIETAGGSYPRYIASNSRIGRRSADPGITALFRVVYSGDFGKSLNDLIHQKQIRAYQEYGRFLIDAADREKKIEEETESIFAPYETAAKVYDFTGADDSVEVIPLYQGDRIEYMKSIDEYRRMPGMVIGYTDNNILSQKYNIMKKRNPDGSIVYTLDTRTGKIILSAADKLIIDKDKNLLKIAHFPEIVVTLPAQLIKYQGILQEQQGLAANLNNFETEALTRDDTNNTLALGYMTPEQRTLCSIHREDRDGSILHYIEFADEEKYYLEGRVYTPNILAVEGLLNESGIKKEAGIYYIETLMGREKLSGDKPVPMRYAPSDDVRYMRFVYQKGKLPKIVVLMSEERIAAEKRQREENYAIIRMPLEADIEVTSKEALSGYAFRKRLVTDEYTGRTGLVTFAYVKTAGRWQWCPVELTKDSLKEIANQGDTSWADVVRKVISHDPSKNRVVCETYNVITKKSAISTFRNGWLIKKQESVWRADEGIIGITTVFDETKGYPTDTTRDSDGSLLYEHNDVRYVPNTNNTKIESYTRIEKDRKGNTLASTRFTFDDRSRVASEENLINKEFTLITYKPNGEEALRITFSDRRNFDPGKRAEYIKIAENFQKAQTEDNKQRALNAGIVAMPVSLGNFFVGYDYPDQQNKLRYGVFATLDELKKKGFEPFTEARAVRNFRLDEGWQDIEFFDINHDGMLLGKATNDRNGEISFGVFDTAGKKIGENTYGFNYASQGAFDIRELIRYSNNLRPVWLALEYQRDDVFYSYSPRVYGLEKAFLAAQAEAKARGKVLQLFARGTAFDVQELKDGVKREGLQWIHIEYARGNEAIERAKDRSARVEDRRFIADVKHLGLMDNGRLVEQLAFKCRNNTLDNASLSIEPIQFSVSPKIAGKAAKYAVVGFKGNVSDPSKAEIKLFYGQKTLKQAREAFRSDREGFKFLAETSVGEVNYTEDRSSWIGLFEAQRNGRRKVKLVRYEQPVRIETSPSVYELVHGIASIDLRDTNDKPVGEVSFYMHEDGTLYDNPFVYSENLRNIRQPEVKGSGDNISIKLEEIDSEVIDPYLPVAADVYKQGVDGNWKKTGINIDYRGRTLGFHDLEKNTFSYDVWDDTDNTYLGQYAFAIKPDQNIFEIELGAAQLETWSTTPKTGHYANQPYVYKVDTNDSVFKISDNRLKALGIGRGVYILTEADLTVLGILKYDPNMKIVRIAKIHTPGGQKPRLALFDATMPGTDKEYANIWDNNIAARVNYSQALENGEVITHIYARSDAKDANGNVIYGLGRTEQLGIRIDPLQVQGPIGRSFANAVLPHGECFIGIYDVPENHEIKSRYADPILSGLIFAEPQKEIKAPQIVILDSLGRIWLEKTKEGVVQGYKYRAAMKRYENNSRNDDVQAERLLVVHENDDYHILWDVFFDEAKPIREIESISGLFAKFLRITDGFRNPEYDITSDTLLRRAEKFIYHQTEAYSPNEKAVSFIPPVDRTDLPEDAIIATAISSDYYIPGDVFGRSIITEVGHSVIFTDRWMLYEAVDTKRPVHSFKMDTVENILFEYTTVGLAGKPVWYPTAVKKSLFGPISDACLKEYNLRYHEKIAPILKRIETELNIGKDTSIDIVKEIPWIAATGADGVNHYSRPTLQQENPTLMIMMPNDPLGRDIMRILPPGQKDSTWNSVLINKWWLEGKHINKEGKIASKEEVRKEKAVKVPFGVLPGRLLVHREYRDFRIEDRVYIGSVDVKREIDSVTEGLYFKSLTRINEDGKEEVLDRLYIEGPIEKAYVYDIYGDDFLVREILSKEGPLAMSTHKYQIVRLANGVFANLRYIPGFKKFPAGIITRGFETTYFDLNTAYQRPLFSRLSDTNVENRRWLNIKYDVSSNGKQIETHKVYEQVPLSPDKYFEQIYEYENGNFIDKSGADILKDWLSERTFGLSTVSIGLMLSVSFLILIPFASRTLARTLRKVVRKFKYQGLIGGSGSPPSESESLRFTSEQDVNSAIDSYPDYGFSPEYVAISKSQVRIPFTRKIAGKENEQDLIDELLMYYRNWYAYVLNPRDDYNLSLDDIMEEVFTPEDFYLFHLIMNSAGLLSHGGASNFIAYLFHNARIKRDKGENDIYLYIHKEVDIWMRLLDVQFGHTVGPFSIRSFITQEYLIGPEDINDLFRSQKFLREYDDPSGELRTKLYNHVGQLEAVIPVRPNPKDKKIYMKLLSNKDHMMWKTYRERTGGFMGIKGNLTLIRVFYWTLFTPFVIGFNFILMPYISLPLIATLPITIAGLIIGKTLLELYYHFPVVYKSAAMDTGFARYKGSYKENLFLAVFWTLVLIPKIAWDYLVFYKWITVPTKLLLSSTPIFSASPLLITAVAWLPFVLFSILSLWVFAFVGEAIIAHFYGSWLGVDKIQMWPGVGKYFEKSKQEYINKLLPEEIEGGWGDEKEKKEKQEVAWAKTWNVIIEKLYEERKLKERARYSYTYIDSSGKTIIGINGEDKTDHLAGNMRNTNSPDLTLRPLNKEARERLEHFVTTLFMEMRKAPKNWNKVKTLTTLIPIGDEIIWDSFNEYNRKEETTGKSKLGQKMSLFKDEWSNLVDALERGESSFKNHPIYSKKPNFTLQEIDILRNLKPHETLDLSGCPNAEWLKQEVRAWCGYLGQEFFRTARGIMYKREAFKNLAKICFPKRENEFIEQKVDQKYRCIVGYSFYGAKGKEDNTRSCNIMMAMYRGMEMAYFVGERFDKATKATLHKEHIIVTSKRDAAGIPIINSIDKTGWEVSPVIPERYKIDLAERGVTDQLVLEMHGGVFDGHPKASALNACLRFIDTEIQQSMDINQDGYFEEWLKAPNMLEEFNDPDVDIAGFPERIFTSSWGWQAWINAFSDRSFVRPVQRFLALGGIRKHYGHPDYHRVTTAKRKGGVASIAAVNEDIFTGYDSNIQGALAREKRFLRMLKNVFLRFLSRPLLSNQGFKARGGKIIYREYMQAGKAREMVYMKAKDLFSKFGMGAAEQITKRHMFTLNRFAVLFNIVSKYGFLRAFTHATLGLGFYIKEHMTVPAIGTIIFVVLFLGLSFFVGFPIATLYGIIGFFMSQSIGFVGLYMLQQEPESGIIYGLFNWLIHLPGLMAHYIAHVFNNAVGFLLGILGKAVYLATGRGPVLGHLFLFRPSKPTKFIAEDEKGMAKDLKKYKPIMAGEIYDNFRKRQIRTFLILSPFIIGGMYLWFSLSLSWMIFFILMPFMIIITPTVLTNRGSTAFDVGIKTWARLLINDTIAWALKLWEIAAGEPEYQEELESGIRKKILKKFRLEKISKLPLLRLVTAPRYTAHFLAVFIVGIIVFGLTFVVGTISCVLRGVFYDLPSNILINKLNTVNEKYHKRLLAVRRGEVSKDTLIDILWKKVGLTHRRILLALSNGNMDEAKDRLYKTMSAISTTKFIKQLEENLRNILESANILGAENSEIDAFINTFWNNEELLNEEFRLTLLAMNNNEEAIAKKQLFNKISEISKTKDEKITLDQEILTGQKLKPATKTSLSGNVDIEKELLKLSVNKYSFIGVDNIAAIMNNFTEFTEDEFERTRDAFMDIIRKESDANQSVQKMAAYALRLFADRRVIEALMLVAQMPAEPADTAKVPDTLPEPICNMNLIQVADYSLQYILATDLLKVAPNVVAEESQAIIVYSDALMESKALQEVLSSVDKASRKYYLVNKSDMSDKELLQKAGIAEGTFDHVFKETNPEIIVNKIMPVLAYAGISQVRVFALENEDRKAWSRQNIVDVLLVILKSREFDIMTPDKRNKVLYEENMQHTIMLQQV